MVLHTSSAGLTIEAVWCLRFCCYDNSKRCLLKYMDVLLNTWYNKIEFVNCFVILTDARVLQVKVVLGQSGFWTTSMIKGGFL